MLQINLEYTSCENEDFGVTVLESGFLAAHTSEGEKEGKTYRRLLKIPFN